MLNTIQRVIVAIENDEARSLVSENLKADGYEPIAVTGLGHATSRARISYRLTDTGLTRV
jgi:hypothetical protein